jgi:hypothetical protein
MKPPADLVIAPRKLTHYLLVKQRRGNKSAFLARAGYNQETVPRLEADLRRLAVQGETTLVKSNSYGDYYETAGWLHGPNGLRLRVTAVWMTECLSGRTKFITLIPG